MTHKHPPYRPAPRLPRTGVESHAHLDSKRFSHDLKDVLRRAAAAGVAQIGQVFLSPQAWEKGKDCFPEGPEYPDVFFLLGIHPSDAHTFPEDVPERLREIIARYSRIRAVGEIGLDYHWKECPPEVQKKMFIRQLHLAEDCGLPVVIHCREALEDTLAILKAEGFSDYPLLWHCFGEGPETARRLADAGRYISIPGPVTFPSNAALREAVAVIPADRLLVETDCPYLAPMPLRGKRNEPAYLAYTIEAMAEARRMDAAELWTLCGDNARRFFGVK